MINASTNASVIDQLAWTVALLLSGVAAGMFLMDLFGYYPLLLRLPDHTAIQLHQEAVPLHRGIFRLVTIGAAVACIVLIIFFSDKTSRWWLIASLACLVLLVLYTNLALIALNKDIVTWTADTPPADWKARFSEMIFRERLRSVLPVLAFVLVLAASRVDRGAIDQVDCRCRQCRLASIRLPNNVVSKPD